MTHAMLLTGVDVVRRARRRARRWRVENSWGDEKADKGFWTMNDAGSLSTSSRSPYPRRRCPRTSCRRSNRADRAARLGPYGRSGRMIRTTAHAVRD